MCESEWEGVRCTTNQTHVVLIYIYMTVIMVKVCYASYTN